MAEDNEFLTDVDFGQYRTLIYNESGIHFTSTNRSILESRLKERLREKGLDSPRSYYLLISKNSEELKDFLDSVTTNLTHFFRNDAHFKALENFVIPELLKIKQGTPNPTLKVWSAGCSTGEEPYSIAMLMSEILPPPGRFEIVASDISLKSLMEGRKGFYGDARIEGIPEGYLRKYCTRLEGGYQFKPEIMGKIRFDYHNLKHDSGQRNVDLVLCRNVIIYFDEVAQLEVIKRFWEVMAPKSFLFIGHSESLFGMDTKFEFVKTQWATFYRKYI
ncbi:MAG: protein-glutamate O-methyltransferase CheR [Spirochaetaceae bacterium]|jgi:chemotaxis protein methyltransferase CheR|nr:protein-glutamate O-methyltransferase CheR [Spirochaetaceae bacterium]